MPIQIGGIVSGIDTEDVISKLLELDAKRKEKLETDKKDIEEEKDLFSTFNSKLLSVKAESDNLLLSSTFQKRSATSNDTTVVTPTVVDGATPGTYAILVDRLATQSRLQSTAAINTSNGFRSTASVSPGTSPIDLSKPFATAGFDSSLNTARTVTIDTDATGGSYTSAALSTYASVQAFIDQVNADAEAVNLWYDSANDRFNIERKNKGGTNTIDIDDSGAGSFWDVANIDEDAASTDATGLNANAILSSLNTDTAITTSGTLTVNGVAITYTVGSDSLNGMISKINNQQATTGATAFYDQSLDRIVFTRTSEGPQTITVTDSNGAGGLLQGLKLNGAATTLGSQALFSINGNSITSDTNSYTFQGITLNLKKQGNADGMVTGADASATVTVTADTASVSTSIKSFVTKYNEFVDFLKEKATFDPETLTSGPLFGDSLVNTVDVRLKKLLIQSQPALLDTHEVLSQIGITLGKLGTEDVGRLVVDDAKLTSAIAANSQAVEQLFGRVASGTTKNAGVAFSVSDYIDQLTKSKGLIDVKEDNINDKIEDIDERIQREEDRLERLEASLRRQFTAMEGALALINAQGSAVTQQLNRL